MSEWEINVIDFSNSWVNISYKNNKILQLTPYNIWEIKNILSNNEILKTKIVDFQENKIDSKELQNIINNYFSEKDLYDEYIYSNSFSLSDFCLRNIFNKDKNISTNLFQKVLETRKNTELRWFFEIISNLNLRYYDFYKLIHNLTNKDSNIYKIFNNEIDFKKREDLFKQNKIIIFLNIIINSNKNINEITKEYNDFISLDLEKFIENNDKIFDNIKNTNNKNINESLKEINTYKILRLQKHNHIKAFKEILWNLKKNIYLNYSEEDIEKIKKWDFLWTNTQIDNNLSNILKELLNHLIYFEIKDIDIINDFKEIINIYVSANLFNPENKIIIQKLDKIWISFLYEKESRSLNKKLVNLWEKYLESKRNNIDKDFLNIDENLLLKLSLEEWISETFFNISYKYIENEIYEYIKKIINNM